MGVFYREVLLVVAHPRDQNLFGKVEIALVEAAQDDGGPLGEVDDSIEQVFVSAAMRAFDRSHRRVQSLYDVLLSLVSINDHVDLLERSAIIGCVFKLDFTPQDAMTVRGASCFHAGELTRNNLVIQHGDDP